MKVLTIIMNGDGSHVIELNELMDRADHLKVMEYLAGMLCTGGITRTEARKAMERGYRRAERNNRKLS